jgi:hypothetical protein
MREIFEEMLTGGHPNSLGRTLEVVDAVLADRARFADLMDTYRSEDEVVRLRVSSAVKRVTVEHPDWTMDYMDRLQSEIADLDQPSAQWTLALLFDYTRHLMSQAQDERAVAIMKRNLMENDDWIVLNNSMKILSKWAKGDAALRAWLRPHLVRLTDEPRKSVAAQARKALALVEKAST